MRRNSNYLYLDVDAWKKVDKKGNGSVLANPVDTTSHILSSCRPRRALFSPLPQTFSTTLLYILCSSSARLVHRSPDSHISWVRPSHHVVRFPSNLKDYPTYFGSHPPLRSFFCEICYSSFIITTAETSNPLSLWDLSKNFEKFATWLIHVLEAAE